MRPVRPGKTGLQYAVGGQRNACVRVHEPETVQLFDEGGLTVERLTYDFCVGSVHCNQVRGADNLECGEVCQRQDDDGCATCPIARAFDRLAAIEDILGDEYDLDRLRELVQADREGRCVVLPCKFGNKVYFPLLGRIIEKTVYSIVTFSNSQRIYCDGTSEFFRPENFGKTVFLTRAAAEKALEEMEENWNG